MMALSLRFRRASARDVDAIVALVESAYRGDASRAGWTTEADLLDGQRTDAAQVRALIAGVESRLVLALAGAELVGSMQLEREPHALYVGMLAVDPRRQAQGIGRALLGEAERIAREEVRRDCLRMTVLGQRRAVIAWYERRGYRRTGRRLAFPYGEPRFGLPRRPDLYFEELEKTLCG